MRLTPAAPSAPGQPQNQDSATNLRTLVSQNYSIKNIALKEETIPESLNSLIIARPTEEFTDYELFQIDQFLMQGKSLALIIDRFNEIMPQGQQGMSMGQQPVFIPLDTGLEKLLSHYGIRIQQSLVMDENCYRQELPAQFGGGDRAIYFAPLIKDPDRQWKTAAFSQYQRVIPGYGQIARGMGYSMRTDRSSPFV